ncbi:MAG: ribosome maturation factor RimM [Firmicutes bacterium]|nr:ribosome maturation factor RimM [Bacillota bacterium]
MILVGRVTSTHGLLGEVKVSVLTDFPERFLEDRFYFLSISSEPGKMVKMEVEKSRLQGSKAVMKFRGFSSIDEAKKLKGAEIYIEEADLKPIPPDTFYQFQIIGLDVYLETGELIGKLTEILDLPSNDVYVVQGKKEVILVPALKKVIKKIDLEQKKMWIKLLEEFINED